jgi:hypothetical protein
LDDLKQDHERRLELLKDKIASKLKLKYTDAENEINQRHNNTGVLKKEIEIYKRLKEQELKKAKGEIDE